MLSQRKSREAALKILYKADILGEEDIGKVMATFFAENAAIDSRHDFVDSIVRGVTERRDEIDSTLDRVMLHWETKRLGYMERAILRIGIYEILFDQNAKEPVAINEAVELAKRYCDPKSKGFINAALDRAFKDKSAGES